MKKVALFALFGLLVVGLVGFADDDIPTDSEFAIPNSYDFSSDGALTFTTHDEVSDPGHIGWCETDVLGCQFSTNYNLTIGLKQGKFHSGANELDTQAGGTGTMMTGWMDKWQNVTQVAKTWIATKAFGPGVYEGDFQLRVYRNGYNDPAGTYVSLCYLQVYTE